MAMAVTVVVGLWAVHCAVWAVWEVSGVLGEVMGELGM